MLEWCSITCVMAGDEPERQSIMAKTPTLEAFLKGEPLNEEMERLMKGEEDEPVVEMEAVHGPRNYADGVPITDHDREYVRKLLTEPGWRVLLKLLDTEISGLEDAARAGSLRDPFAHEHNSAAWADASYTKRAREKLEQIAEHEVLKLRKRKDGAVLGR